MVYYQYRTRLNFVACSKLKLLQNRGFWLKYNTALKDKIVLLLLSASKRKNKNKKTPCTFITSCLQNHCLDGNTTSFKQFSRLAACINEERLGHMQIPLPRLASRNQQSLSTRPWNAVLFSSCFVLFQHFRSMARVSSTFSCSLYLNIAMVLILVSTDVRKQ